MKEDNMSFTSILLESVVAFALHTILSVGYFKHSVHRSRLNGKLTPNNQLTIFLPSSQKQELLTTTESVNRDSNNDVCDNSNKLPALPQHLSETLVNEFISRGIVVIPQVLNEYEVEDIKLEFHKRLRRSGV